MPSVTGCSTCVADIDPTRKFIKQERKDKLSARKRERERKTAVKGREDATRKKSTRVVERATSHLETGVELEKEVLLGLCVEEELNGSGALVADVLREALS
jgi:hypothetical protein